MWQTKHHKFFHIFVKPVIRPFIYIKNNFRSKYYRLPKSDRPYILIANHQTTDDPFLLIASLKDIVYPVTSKDFVPIKYRKAAQKLIGPVYKAKTLKDIGAVKYMLSVLREGNNLMLYPEGNRTFSGNLCYINDSTIKLIIKSKANLAIYNFHGGYGYDPRYSTSKRKGPFYGKMKKIISYKELEKMSFEEIKNLVIENLTVQEAPSKERYKSSSRAEALERCLYRCPICGEIGTLSSKGNFITCSKCNLEVEYLDNLTFKSSNPNFHHLTVGDWFKEQEEYIKAYQVKENEVIFKDDNCTLEKLFFDHEDFITKGKLEITDKYIKVNDTTFTFNEIKEMTVSGKQTLIIYIGSDSYRIASPTIGFNPIKYMQMYYHITNINLGFEDKFLGI